MEHADARFDDGLQAIVTGEGRIVPLRPQSSDVLRLLVANAGQIVSKSEILDEVWGDRDVTEDVVYQCISEIRKAFGMRGSAILRTVSRKGYVYGCAPVDPVPVLSSIEAPLLAGAEPIRYVRSADDTRIAWTASGSGIAVLKTPNFVSHLGAERRSRLYVPFYERLGQIARIVRYDQRGSGLSRRFTAPLDMRANREDMLTVAEAAGIDRFFLLGLSQGVPYAVDFAARYPEKVVGIIGRGGFALGDLAGGQNTNRQTFEAAMSLATIGWESYDPTYKRHFTSRVMPDAPPAIASEFDDLQRLAIPKDNLLDYLRFDANIDVTTDAPKVRCPVLLLHAEGDRMVPIEDGRQLASLLPDCEFVTLPGIDHTSVPGSPAFELTLDHIERFLGRHAAAVG